MMKSHPSLSAASWARTAAALAVLALSAPAQEAGAYRSYSELTAALRGLAAGAPAGLVRLASIGRTLQGRDLWALEIAAPSGTPPAERPALLIAAGFEGDRPVGPELALAAAARLAKGYPGDAAVKKALDAFTVYVLPSLNPDALEAFFASPKTGRRTNAVPIDDDNDGRTDEDGPEDLNGDGLITVMRVKDPAGAYMIDPEEKRLMRRADPKKGERGEFALYTEGVDNDGDGFLNEDPPGGADINRNFMHEYPYYKPEAGRYMAGEAETRAVLEWMLAHRNIAAILVFGEHDNLIAPPSAGGRMGSARSLDLLEFAAASNAEANKTGMFGGGLRGLLARFGGGGDFYISEDMLRDILGSGAGRGQGSAAPGGARAESARPQRPVRQPATTIDAADAEIYKAAAAKYAELTGLRAAPVLAKAEGAFFQYGHFQFGVPAFTTPGWGLSEPPRPAGPGGGGPPPQVREAGAVPPAARTGRAFLPGAASGGGSEEAGSGIDKAVLQWMDRDKIDGFAAWSKVKHPQFGEVEVGGFKPYAAQNPPADRLGALGRSHAEFALFLTTLFPRVEIASFTAEPLGGGIHRVKAEISNEGVWPTATSQAVNARALKPVLVQLQVKPETILSGASKSNSVRALAGSGGRARFEWIVRAGAGETLALKVISPNAGRRTGTVTLK